MRNEFHGSINGSYLKGKNFFKKSFPKERNINFERELIFYNYCEKNNVDLVPKVLEIQRQKKTIYLQRIEGHSPKSVCLDFLGALCKLMNNLLFKRNFIYKPFAEEYCLNRDDLFSNILKRINNIKGLDQEYLGIDLARVFERKVSNLQIPFDFGPEICNPSDVGIHNSIVNSSGFKFIDFEYSGRDSFVKFGYDFLLHPANNISPNEYVKIFSFFKKSIIGFNLDIDNNILNIFRFWWVVRLLNSLKAEIIDRRLGTGNINKQEISRYISQRLDTANNFLEETGYA